MSNDIHKNLIEPLEEIYELAEKKGIKLQEIRTGLRTGDTTITERAKMAKKPPDKEHPFGHGRIEYVATIIIAILLILIGLGFIQQSIERFNNLGEFANNEYALMIGIIIIISGLLLPVFSNLP